MEIFKFSVSDSGIRIVFLKSLLHNELHEGESLGASHKLRTNCQLPASDQSYMPSPRIVRSGWIVRVKCKGTLAEATPALQRHYLRNISRCCKGLLVAVKIFGHWKNLTAEEMSEILRRFLITDEQDEFLNLLWERRCCSKYHRCTNETESNMSWKARMST